MLESLKFIKISIKLILSGGALLFFAWKKQSYRGRLKLKSAKDIRSAAEGKVQLHGTAIQEDQYKNLQGEDVAFLYWSLEYRKNKLFSLSPWTSVKESSLGSGFKLKDSSDAIRVHMKNAEMVIKERTYSWNKLNDHQKNLFYSWYGQNSVGNFLSKYLYRITTYEIPQGSPVTICGQLVRENINSHKLAVNVSTQVTPSITGSVKSTKEVPLLVFTGYQGLAFHQLGNWLKVQVIIGGLLFVLGLLVFLGAFFNSIF